MPWMTSALRLEVPLSLHFGPSLSQVACFMLIRREYRRSQHRLQFPAGAECRQRKDALSITTERLHRLDGFVLFMRLKGE